MRILSITGKVDTRSIVYPLARALGLNGNTGVITDDGAYRRLYHGKGNLGNVSGIDLSICSDINDETIHSLDSSGIGYDNLIIVSSNYICPSAEGVIICHGLDRSMLAVENEEDDDDFIFAIPKPSVEVEDANKSKGNGKVSKGKQSKKNEPVTEDTSSTEDNYDISSENDEAAENVDEQPKEETLHDRIIRLQNENPDKIVVPNIENYTEVQIAYAPAPKRGMLGISLKDGIINYIYTCEETKELKPVNDKNYNTLIAKIAAKPLKMDTSELFNLLSREEGTGKSVGKKK